MNIKEFKMMRLSGTSNTKIAEHFGITQIYSSFLARKLNLPKRDIKRGRIRWRKKEIKKIDLIEFKQMYLKGATYKEMTKHFNTYKNRIHFLVNQMNLPKRSRFPPQIKLSIKGLSFEKLAKAFSTRTIPPFGEGLMIPESKFNELWKPLLEKEGHKIVFIAGNNSCYLVHKAEVN